jgi:nicotinamidase/pyrazinamidase
MEGFINTEPLDRVALIAVDVQHDFIEGALAVAHGKRVIKPIMEMAADPDVDLVVATRDWHPWNHSSFESQGGPWPMHCVAATKGAAIHPLIDRVADLIVSKGMHAEFEQYGAFEGTNLAEMLRAQGVNNLLIGGLATDYCVKQTALQACAYGFSVVVKQAACRAVELKPGDEARALDEMREAGCVVA